MSDPMVERVYPPKIMFLVLNPIMRWLVGTRLGKWVPDLARLEFTGRKSSKPYSVVTAIHDIDGRNAVLTNSGWRWNFDGGRNINMVLAGQRKDATATLVTETSEVVAVYQQMIDRLGMDKAPRRLGIKSADNQKPTDEQLAGLVEREGLSLVYIEPVT